MQLRTQEATKHPLKGIISSAGGKAGVQQGDGQTLVEESAQPQPGLALCSHFHHVFVVRLSVCLSVVEQLY